MKSIVAVAVATISLGVATPTPAPKSLDEKPVKVAAMCFKTGEQQSGMTKICYYDCLGSPAAITIGATSLCPLTINR